MIVASILFKNRKNESQMLVLAGETLDKVNAEFAMWQNSGLKILETQEVKLIIDSKGGNIIRRRGKVESILSIISDE